MAVSLEALEVIDAIDRRGSFAAAADELGRVPSAITYTIRRLEDELDVLLFDRRGRRARFTQAGRALLDQGRALLAQAAAIEQRVQRVATGWETEIRVAVDTIVPLTRIWPLAARFYEACGERQAAHTELSIRGEVFGGAWDALAQGRAELVIGASGDPPPGGGFRSRLLAEVPFVFVVAPTHPLAAEQGPVGDALLARHRLVVAADTSRKLPPRTIGLLDGQPRLAVPDLPAKVAAQVAGLGCGWLPYYLVADEVAHGRLVIREAESPRPPVRILAAWRERHPGRALAWWLEAIDAADWRFLAAAPAAAVAARAERPPRRPRRRTR